MRGETNRQLSFGKGFIVKARTQNTTLPAAMRPGHPLQAGDD